MATSNPAPPVLPPLDDGTVKIAYVGGELCIIRRFKGPKAMPLDVVYAIRPLSGDNLFDGSDVAEMNALRPTDSNAPDFRVKLLEYQKRLFIQNCKVVSRHLRSWNLIVEGNAVLAFDDPAVLVKSAPALLIADIHEAIQLSAVPDPETGNTPVEDVAKKLTPPSDSP